MNQEEHWIWTESEDKCINSLKELITTAPILAHFNSQKDVVVSVDASQNGLDYVLLQATLTSAQCHWALIEK